MTRPLVSLAVASISLLVGCETEDATMAVVDNAYPVASDGAATTEITVYKVWWRTTLFLDAVAPGAEGATERTVPTTDTAYAVLAPGWDPSSPHPPAVLLAAKSVAPLSVARGDLLHITISDATFIGNCASGRPLSQDEADFITQRIFPGDFAGVTYDANTCTSTPLASDAGTD